MWVHQALFNIVLLCPLLVFAECREGLLKQVVSELGYSSQENAQGNFLACQPWPADPQKSVVAVASSRKSMNAEESAKVNEDSFGDYDLEIVVVKTDSGKVLQQSFQKEKLDSVLTPLQGIEIDTRTYILAKNVFAFGLLSKHAQSATYDQISKEILNLYVPKGKQLNNVLKDFPLRYTKKSVKNCSGFITEVITNIELGELRKKGYVDLLTTEIQAEINSMPTSEPGKCALNRTETTEQYLIYFDGKEFVPPNSL